MTPIKFHHALGDSEAMQITPYNMREVAAWANGHIKFIGNEAVIHIQGVEWHATVGEWIVKGARGTLYKGNKNYGDIVMKNKPPSSEWPGKPEALRQVYGHYSKLFYPSVQVTSDTIAHVVQWTGGKYTNTFHSMVLPNGELAEMGDWVMYAPETDRFVVEEDHILKNPSYYTVLDIETFHSYMDRGGIKDDRRYVIAVTEENMEAVLAWALSPDDDEAHWSSAKPVVGEYVIKNERNWPGAVGGSVVWSERAIPDHYLRPGEEPPAWIKRGEEMAAGGTGVGAKFQTSQHRDPLQVKLDMRPNLAEDAVERAIQEALDGVHVGDVPMPPVFPAPPRTVTFPVDHVTVTTSGTFWDGGKVEQPTSEYAGLLSSLEEWRDNLLDDPTAVNLRSALTLTEAIDAVGRLDDLCA